MESGWSVADREGIAPTYRIALEKVFARYHMGFPFATDHDADVLFLHAYG